MAYTIESNPDYFILFKFQNVLKHGTFLAINCKFWHSQNGDTNDRVSEFAGRPLLPRTFTHRGTTPPRDQVARQVDTVALIS